ncbi:MAG: hypothetical protein EAZ08_03540 [Cytophagales bacterium]|nr:MAG: hypothetical protein EAZ08_03540 [Cytophagales bacterium]
MFWKLRQSWNKLVSIGVFAEQAPQEARRTRILNTIAWFVILLTAIYLPSLFYLYFFEGENNISGIITNVSTILLISMTLYLNHKRRYFFARIFLVLLINLSIFIASIMAGKVLQMEYAFLIMVAVLVIFFDNWNTIRYLASISFILFWLTKWHHAYFNPLLSNVSYRYFMPLNLSMMFFGLLFIIKNFKNEFTRYAQIIEQQNQSIFDQNEELQSQAQAINRQNEELAKKNDDVAASISYAQRIQAAILPSLEENIEKNLQKDMFFILYKPRNIVSGDFYFFEQIDDKLVIIAADCTGHGVPGALMSMIGMNTLEEIVVSLKITQADNILNQLHKKIQYALKQQETNNRDGMDISVCVIDKANNSMEYAGANNPMYVIQEGVLHEYKADKLGIGGYQTETERIFTKHFIDISKPTIFYLFSDGYQDQFGGADNRKFMKKRFRELLFSIHHEPLHLQKTILDNTLKNWQMDYYEQTDDILVMGIKIK